jgi:Cd2+/Zn2+-exporting ATPase
MPWQKVDAIDGLIADKKGSVVFMGDGINDAPVLARADAGVAMGALGSDAAIEAADIVIMDDAPSKLITAIAIARKTKTIVRENIVFALGVKAAVLVLAALGFANMWIAVFADVGVALLAVANALRAGRSVNT